MGKTLFTALGVLLGVFPVSAQVHESIEVRVMELQATVVDGAGKPVQGLTPSDFRVVIGGAPAPISNFFAVQDGVVTGDEAAARTGSATPQSIQTNVLIFIDELHLTPASRRASLAALTKYVSKSFDRNTLATIVRYNKHFDLRLRPTSNVEEIVNQLELLEYEPFVNDAEEERHYVMKLLDGALYGDSETPDVAGESPDTIFARLEKYAEARAVDVDHTVAAMETAVRLASAFHGRKVLLYVSEGLPQQPALEMFEYWDQMTRAGGGHVWRQETQRLDMSRAMTFDRSAQFKHLAETAQRAEVAIYSFDAGRLRGYEARGIDMTKKRATLNTASFIANVRSGPIYMAQETGGTFMANDNDLSRVLSQMSKQFSTYYSIGVRFQPGEVQVTIPKHPEWRVTASRRLEPRTRDEVVEESLRSRLYTRLAENPLDVKIEVSPAVKSDARCMATATLWVPQRNLPSELTPRNVDVTLVMLNADNDESKAQRFSLPMAAPGVRHTMMLRIKPQLHVLSVGIFNPASGETSYLQADVDGTPCATQ